MKLFYSTNLSKTKMDTHYISDSKICWSVLDIFSQICDGNGMMVMWKFNEYLQDVLALPAAVYESPSFPYSSQLANDIFPLVRNKIVWSTFKYITFSILTHRYVCLHTEIISKF